MTFSPPSASSGRGRARAHRPGRSRALGQVNTTLALVMDDQAVGALLSGHLQDVERQESVQESRRAEPTERRQRSPSGYAGSRTSARRCGEVAVPQFVERIKT